MSVASRRSLRTVLAAAVLGSVLGSPGSVTGASALVALELHMVPNPAAYGAPVTFYGAVTRVSGSPTNVRVSLELPPSYTGECTPACIPGSRHEWLFDSVSGRTTFKLDTTSTGLGQFARLYLAGGSAGCAVGCPVEISLARPIIKTTLVYSSGAPVVSGTRIRVKAGASTNASPIEGILVVGLPTGLGTPTNISGGANYWAGPPAQVEGLIVLQSTGGYEFDIPITAANGTSLTLTAWFGPDATPSTMVVNVGSDSTRPTTTAPTAKLATGSRAGGAPVRVAWSGSDTGSGVERYVLGQQVDGGSWTTVSSSLTSTSAVRPLATGHTYRFRVRAVDHAGNVGVWTYGSTIRLKGHSETNATLSYSGTWTSSSSTSYWGGRAKKASIVGAKAALRATMRSASWVTTRGPNRGRAAVYVNGTRVATVDLWAPSVEPQRVVWARSWSTTAIRTVVIKVLTAYGRQRVDLDGMVTIR